MNIIETLEQTMNKTIHDELKKRSDEIAEELTKEFEERLQKEQYKIINQVTANIAMRCNLGIMGQTVEFVIRHK